MATHEVADCQPTEVVVPLGCTWEPCAVTRETRDTFDVRIFLDGETKDLPKRFEDVQGVPKRFVRPLKESADASIPKKRKSNANCTSVSHTEF